GLASWKDGTLTLYPETTDHFIFAVVEDHEGAVWVAASSITLGKLCAVRAGRMACDGEGTFGRGPLSLHADSAGNLWAGSLEGIWRWNPGPPKFYLLQGEARGHPVLAEDARGTLLVAINRRLYQFIGGKLELYPPTAGIRPSGVNALLCDREGGLWVGTNNQ